MRAEVDLVQVFPKPVRQAPAFLSRARHRKITVISLRCERAGDFRQLAAKGIDKCAFLRGRDRLHGVSQGFSRFEQLNALGVLCISGSLERFRARLRPHCAENHGRVLAVRH
ncbi:hypothetical protein FZI85_27505 [Mycobacterium sp. CBMA293]|nr:hypothetical protein [Mycolicibacterium sp. CBMA 360]MUL62354.1 hypothetical protein [Mycolicibacterium sp. CBMA 335]MUM14754.1 hypothetical protein [Mycolicibacterium sp. CBMA 293]